MTQVNEGRTFPKELTDVLRLARDYVQKDFDGFGDPRESDILKRIDAIIVRQSPDTIPAGVTMEAIKKVLDDNCHDGIDPSASQAIDRIERDIRELFEKEKA